jgi:TonB family protein
MKAILALPILQVANLERAIVWFAEPQVGVRRIRHAAIAGVFLALAVGSVGRAAEPAPKADVEVDAVLEQALAFDEGRTVARDSAAAAGLYRQAAEAGVAVAHLRLGKMFETADGVAQDYLAAREHYRRAAELGLPDGHLQLAICYLEGWGGPANRAAFLEQLNTAAAAGYAPAQRILSGVHMSGLGVPADPAQALQWAERAAAQDDARAQVVVGHLVERSRNLMNDVKLARTWYQLAAENEYTAAMQKLAATFLRPDSLNIELARRWLQLAADSGDSGAKYNLAALETRAGGEAELVDRLLTEAAAEGDFDAAEVLSLVAGGRSQREAFAYIHRTPRMQRYVASREQQFADAVRTGANHPPVIRRMVEPIYPLSLLLTETEGRAMIEFIVAVDGRVESARIHEATHPELGARAMEAVRHWRFLPAVRNQRTVKTRMRVPVMFEMRTRLYRSTDAALNYARRRSEILGPPVSDDMKDARVGRATTRLQRPTMPDGQPVPGPGGALLALVLAADGTPKRGHVLRATPEDAGDAYLAAALKARFEPADESGLTDGVTVILALRAPQPASPAVAR